MPWARWGAAATVLAALAACRSGDAPTAVVKPKAPDVAAPQERSFTCRIVPRETVTAGTALSGYVESVLVDAGTLVADGQVMAIVGKPQVASLNPPAAVSTFIAAKKYADSLQTSVAVRRLTLSRAQAVFAKQELLNREGATPRLVFEKALVDRDTAASELAAEEEASRGADNALAKLEDRQRETVKQNREAVASLTAAAAAEVHAPAAGMVVERNIMPGQAVTEANRGALFRIAPHPDLLRAEFATLPAGQAVSIHAENVSLSAEVAESGQFADFESRTEPLRPGMPCTVTLRIK